MISHKELIGLIITKIYDLVNNLSTQKSSILFIGQFQSFRIRIDIITFNLALFTRYVKIVCVKENIWTCI
jgi:hypothetical protein